MEGMDIDQVVDVPDTPDRVATMRHISSGEYSGKESNCVSGAGLFRNRDFRKEKCSNPENVSNKQLNGSRNCRRLYFRPPKILGSANGTQHHSNLVILSPLENAHPSQNTGGDRNLKHWSEHSTEATHVDKGKSLCTNFSSKAPSLRRDYGGLDLTEQSRPTKITEGAVPPATDFLGEEIRNKIFADADSCLRRPNISSDTCKGKGKMDTNTCKAAVSSTDLGKGTKLSCNSQDKTEIICSRSPQCASPSKAIGRKRLVRNGCISPYNIARATQFADHNSNSSGDVTSNRTGNVVSNAQPCLVEINSSPAHVVSNAKRDSVKGKGVAPHHWTQKKNHPEIIDISGSSPMINNVEVNATANSNRDSFACIERLDGWINTRNRSKSIATSSFDVHGCQSGRNEGVNDINSGCHSRRNEGVNDLNNVLTENIKEMRNKRSGRYNKAESDTQASDGVSEVDRLLGSHPPTNTLKRQKNHVPSTRNHGESSRLASNDSEILVLGSTGRSLNLRSSRTRHQRLTSASHPVIEIDELTPELNHSGSQSTGCVNDRDSDYMARQVEADEMLARELQEQLYQEGPVASEEIDEHIARAMQQEEGALHASSSGNHHVVYPRASLTSQSHRQTRARLQNPSIRRISRLRSNFIRQPSVVPSRGRRHDMLEALEYAPGDNNNMGFHVQRDFNENDYEMLLALDENSHHVGASSNQINNLPESTVHTDNLDETCAICLETPTTGDIIRHLPCLHKFHKSCIDPWLCRKTSCPVCKSSIT